MFKNMALLSGAVVCQVQKGKRKFFLVKNAEDSGWEIPKMSVRKTESSVRAALRMIGEQGGMRARILDEASRYTSNQVVNGKPVTQKIFYYALIHRADSGESIGFPESGWFEYSAAYKKIKLKREKEALSGANQIIKEWWKERKNRVKITETEE